MNNIFDVDAMADAAPNSPCDVLLCKNPHDTTLDINLDGKHGEIDICEDCLRKHIQEALTYFFFVDEKGLDIRIIYFQDEEEELHCDVMWEEVARHFFKDLYRYRKEPEGGLL